VSNAWAKTIEELRTEIDQMKEVINSEVMPKFENSSQGLSESGGLPSNKLKEEHVFEYLQVQGMVRD
jgi:hypothetical protein